MVFYLCFPIVTLYSIIPVFLLIDNYLSASSILSSSFSYYLYPFDKLDTHFGTYIIVALCSSKNYYNCPLLGISVLELPILLYLDSPTPDYIGICFNLLLGGGLDEYGLWVRADWPISGSMVSW